MKKLITILAIMIVLVGAVFAAPAESNGTSIIDITASIGEQFPQYQLKAIGITQDTGTITTPIAVKNGAHGLVEIDTNDLLTADVEVNFQVNQIVNSRTSVGYTIAIKATNLVLNENTGTEQDPVYTPIADPATDERFLVSLGTDAKSFVQTGSEANVVTVTATTTATGAFANTDGGFTVQYLNGKFVNVEQATDGTVKQIGTFTYKWSKNLTAKVGDYTATVTMVVAAI